MSQGSLSSTIQERVRTLSYSPESSTPSERDLKAKYTQNTKPDPGDLAELQCEGNTNEENGDQATQAEELLRLPAGKYIINCILGVEYWDL